MILQQKIKIGEAKCQFIPRTEIRNHTLKQTNTSKLSEVKGWLKHRTEEEKTGEGAAEWGVDETAGREIDTCVPLRIHIVLLWHTLLSLSHFPLSDSAPFEFRAFLSRRCSIETTLVGSLLGLIKLTIYQAQLAHIWALLRKNHNHLYWSLRSLS